MVVIGQLSQAQRARACVLVRELEDYWLREKLIPKLETALRTKADADIMAALDEMGRYRTLREKMDFLCISA